jgi:hypothetical protein
LFGQPGYISGINPRFFAPQLVVEVGDMQFNAQYILQPLQYIQETDRVLTAGNRHQQRLPFFYQPVLLNEV